MQNKELPKYWMELYEIQEKKTLVNELLLELCENHILTNKTINAFARRYDNDEVVFKIDNGQYALVNLTWSGKKEINKDFPYTEIFNDFNSLIENLE